jgi:glycosyltransferase involved in cell wall biosynthesis
MRDPAAGDGSDHGRRPIVLNARAATRERVTGVERWALEVIPRLVELAPDRYVVLAPRATRRSRAASQAWEQLILPLQAARLRASLVWSPANLAPWAWPRNVFVLHDAAVLREPDSYSSAYRVWHGRVGIAGARRALVVVTVSEFSRRELIELGGLDPSRVVVIHGGVDRRFRTDVDHQRVASKLGLDRPYVLTVATDDRRKNLAALGPLAARLAELGIELVWAGGARSHLTGGAPRDGVRAVGYVDEEDLPGLYGGARAFVLPSRYEGYGLTCVEAMACGTPVVASNRGALPETCGDAALLVDPDDSRTVADAVVRAASDEPLRERLREAGLRRAAQATWDRAAQETDALLTSLAQR